MLRVVVILLALLESQVLAFHGLPEGQKYQVVVPEKIHSQHKRDTRSTYPDLVQYKLHVEGQPLVLHLEKTEDLITEDFTVTLYDDNGTRVTTKPQDQDHCCYQGHVKEDDDSSVSICTCKGLSGLIHTRNRRLMIEPLNQTDNGEHAVFEPKEETPRTCGVTNTTWTEGKTSKSSRSGNSEKQNFLKSQKYIQLYVVADTSMFKKYNCSVESVKQKIFEIVNYVNEVYKALTTFVALNGLEVWEKKDLFQVSTSAGINLDRFSSWRKKDLLPRKAHDNAQFITNIDFDGSTVGLAFVGTMCSDSHSSGVIQDHSKRSIAVGATIAHEMGHNMGMNHDSSSCSCTADSCIMAPTLSNKTPFFFSSCSLSNFQTFIYDQMPQCMKDVPSKQYIMSPSVCGNKFTELGEDCDCGTVKECTNPCCDAATCKFKANAECADGECCAQCKIKKVGTVCRPVKDDCDLADMCDGKSPECPKDRFIYNGHPCNEGEGVCYNGQCPMLESQCSQLWGPSAVVGKDECFSVNKGGHNYGHCKNLGGLYVACASTEVKCGVLYCSGGSDNPSIHAPVAMFSNCRGVLALGGMVQNGTKCGDDKVCYDGKCVSTNSAFRSTNCSEKCPGHGVCDHELQCQCQEGWAPPHCDVASDKNIVIIVVIVIIAALLVVGLILMIVFRKRCAKRSVNRISGATNPAFYQPQMKSSSNVSTSEPANRDGYQGPQYSMQTVEFTKNSPALQRPTHAPPPVPTSKPPVPPAKALKPTIRS